MPEIFISYARSTEREAREIAEALRARGYRIWRDDDLPAHRDYSEVIEERLRAARAVVVVWSAEAVKSQWVRAEADVAREAGTLVQVTLDGAALPMPFNRIQCADLADRSFDPTSSGWRKVIASLKDLFSDARPAASAHPEDSGAWRTAAPLLAVLAFDNLSGDPEMDYFSDGISHEILDTVARGSQLKVIAPSSSFQFRGPDKAVRHVVAGLKATHLLDGAVRRAGSRVRISAHLVECEGQTMLWSDRFERELSNVFALQDEIAQAVASALEVALKPAARPEAIRPATYEKYLRALKLYETDGALAVEAGPLFEQIVVEAPVFAAAWENLAMLRANALRASQSGQPYLQARAKVIAAANTALALDPTRGRAVFALSFLEPWAAYAAREEVAVRAAAANPNDSLLVGVLAARRAIVGRAHEALALAERAMELDPLNYQSRSVMIIALDMLGRDEEVLKFYDGWVSEPHHPSLLFSGLVFASRAADWRRFDRWEAMLPQDAPFVHAEEPRLRRYFRNLRTHDRAGLDAAREDFRVALRDTGMVPLDAFRELASYGCAGEALDLARAANFDHLFEADAQFPRGGVMAMSTIFTPALTADPRFVDLCAKLGLVSYWLDTGRWPDCAQDTPYDFQAAARSAAAKAPARRV